jgi:hypothetical protein
VVSNFLGTRDTNQQEKKFAGHIINNIYILYLSVINENTLPSVVPIFGPYNLSEISNNNFNYTYKILNS